MPKFRALLVAATPLLCVALVTPTLSSTANSNAPSQSAENRGAYARLLPPEHRVAVGVPFDLSGHVSTKRVKREVKLQVRVRRGAWRSIKTTTTDRRGKFTFTNVRLSMKARLRSSLAAQVTRVPKVAGGPRTPRLLPATKTKALSIRVRPQRGRLAQLPALNQQGPTPQAPRNDTVVSASFDPPLPGRRVLLERRANGAWQPHRRQREDAAGFAVFNVAPGQTYRATARPFRGAGKVRTNIATTRTRALLFEDTFEGTSLDPRWKDFVLKRSYPGSGRTCALTHSSARSVGGGVLNLGISYDAQLAGQECRYDDTRTSPYLYQSQVVTKDSFVFAHGIAAARIKFARARGRHSAFWIQKGFKVAGDPAAGTEIDVIEYFGDFGPSVTSIGTFLHWIDDDGSSAKLGSLFRPIENMKPVGDTWWDSFHVFSVTWTPTEYVFRVDGREFYREHRAISMTPQWLVLSALTGDYELADVTPENIDDKTKVDWVRVWSL